MATNVYAGTKCKGTVSVVCFYGYVIFNGRNEYEEVC